MFALAFRYYIRDVHAVASDGPDDRRGLALLLGGIGKKSDLGSLYRELSLIGLIQQRARANRSPGRNVLPVVLERSDEFSVRPESDVRGLDALDSWQRVCIEQRAGIETGGDCWCRDQRCRQCENQ